jgi:peptidoglycan/LPS O-acetylase OafA/YrhL
MQRTDGHLKAIADHESSPKGWYLGLDGIRAIAVLLVFSVHYAKEQTLTVGWTGVMIFFVLSGFLITGLLYDNRNEPHRFRNFYIRRTLRIFPLFYFTWLLVLLAGLYLHAQWYGIQILWVTYLGNYVRFFVGSLAQDHIYTQDPNFILEIGHFWSLAVEEQFYLIWPLIVFFVRKRETLIHICIATVVLVPVLRIILFYALPERLLSLEFLYRMTFTQCDGFLLGGLMALYLRGSAKDLLLSNAKKILYISSVLLVLAYLLNNGLHLRELSGTSEWMSTYGFTIVDFMAAGLILCTLQPGTMIYRAMTIRPLRMLGRCSYGFYVYHVLLAPFLNFYVWPTNGHTTLYFHYIHFGLVKIIHFFIVFAVSLCSYHLIELPFLRMKDRFTLHHRNPGAPNAEQSGLPA